MAVGLTNAGAVSGLLQEVWEQQRAENDEAYEALADKANPSYLLRHFMLAHFTASIMQYIEGQVDIPTMLEDRRRYEERDRERRATLARNTVRLVSADCQYQLYDPDEFLLPYELGVDLEAV
jgi:hypothetical protein